VVHRVRVAEVHHVQAVVVPLVLRELAEVHPAQVAAVPLVHQERVVALPVLEAQVEVHRVQVVVDQEIVAEVATEVVIAAVRVAARVAAHHSVDLNHHRRMTFSKRKKPSSSKV
jgi:hypothetical protein